MTRNISTLVRRIQEIADVDEQEALRFIYTAVEAKLSEMSQEPLMRIQVNPEDEYDIYCDSELSDQR